MKYYLIIVTFVVASFVACTSQKENTVSLLETTMNIESEACIPSNINNAYSVWDNSTPVSNITIPPNSKWEIYGDLNSTFNDIYKGLNVNLIPQTSLLVRQNKAGKDQIWAVYSTFLEVNTPLLPQVLKYDIQTSLVEVYKNSYTPYRILKTSDNSIWGIGRKIGFGYSFLSKYNEITNQFELVIDFENLSQLNIDGAILDIAEGKNRTLWLVVETNFRKDLEYKLYSFEIDNKTLLEHPLGEDLSPRKLAIDQDGSLWIITSDFSLITLYFSENTIIKYEDPEIVFIFQEGFQSEKLRGSTLYFDRRGNLWVDNIGWFEFKPQPVWHRLLESPIFLSVNENGQVFHARVNSIFEDSEENIWFNTTVGVVKNKAHDKSWCWVTTFHSNIAEDSSGNLWMIADGKLYKLPLGEQ